MTGYELRYTVRLYTRICELFKNKPDLKWLVTDFGSDERYSTIDITRELRNFGEYWSDRTKRPKSHKRALRNWFARALEDPAPRPRSSPENYGNIDRTPGRMGVDEDPRTAPPVRKPALNIIKHGEKLLEISTVLGYKRCPLCLYSQSTYSAVKEHFDAVHR